MHEEKACPVCGEKILHRYAGGGLYECLKCGHYSHLKQRN